jgi:hypothetical protein
MSESKNKKYKFKLIYLEDRGNIDLIKLIFAFAGKEYENIQIKQTEINLYKKFMLFESLPVLIIANDDNNDEIRLAQSNTICRFLAYNFNLNGLNEIDAFVCDMISIQELLILIKIKFLIFII